MSHHTGMSSLCKGNVLKSSNNLGTCKAHSSHTARVNAVCFSSTKISAHNSSPSKVKRLKTRKERNQIRGQESNKSNTCTQQSRKEGSEKAQHHGSHQGHVVDLSRKKKAFAKPFLPHKPSIITEGRLTSIRGLFSHEVRSVDIERVVSEQLKKEMQRKRPGMHVTSPLPPHPPSMSDSDQDCILSTVQEPLLEPEKSMKVSRKEFTRKYPNALQTNKEATVPKESSRQDEKHGKSAKTGKEDTTNKSRPDFSSSLKGTYELLSSPENKQTLQFCSTPNKPDKNYFDFPEIVSPKSHKENNRTDSIIGVIQGLASTSAMDGIPNIDALRSKSDPSSSEMDSGMGTLTDNEREQISMSVREAVNKLAARLELHVPQRPLLVECRDVLLQSLQQTPSFQLQHNLRKLHSYFDAKRTASFGSGQTHEDCSQIYFSHALENERSEHNRNMDIWTENTIQQEYPAGQDPYRDASIKKRRVQAERRFSPIVSLITPLQEHTDMFDQSRTARLSQDCFRAQHYARTAHFQKDQSFSQLATPIPSTPTWVSPYYEPCFQQPLEDLQRRGKENVGLGFISHQWEENTNPVCMSSSWSNQLQVQNVSEQWAPSSASFPLEGFRYKPFFRFPHPSNSQVRSDLHGMTLCARSNTDKVFYHH